MSWERIDRAHHDLADPHQLERVDAVFARDVMAAARELLGQDRALEQEHGHRIAPRPSAIEQRREKR